jgi:hypothetical protein
VHDYIVTHLNEPPSPAGPANAVRRDQLQEAHSAYQLEPRAGLDLESLVGTQVRAAGVLMDRAHLPSATAPGRPKLEASDLALIDTTAAVSIQGTCGGNASAG